MLDRPSPPETLPATVPLNRLKFGDDRPGGGVNARTSNRRDNLGELAASILALGVITPLIVEQWGRDFYVVEGNRRLAALRQLLAEGRLPKTHPVKVSGLEPGTSPTEASLAANILHLPMHEVDQHEAFARLAAEGQDVAEIASHFGATELMVKRRLALGRLSPAIREAWRDGRIPVDAAQAFTLVEDHALQEQTYQALAKGRNLYRVAVIRALTGGVESWTSRRNLAFVGKKAFVKGGGRIVEDLFEPDAPKVLDPELLTRLTREKVAAACQKLVAEDGWRWALWDEDLPDGHYAWRRAEIPEPVLDESEDKATLARLKARAAGVAEDGGALSAWDKNNAVSELSAFLNGPVGLKHCPLSVRIDAGCKVSLDEAGKLRVRFGYVRPEDARREGSPAAAELGSLAGDAAAPATPAGLSAALSQTLSIQRTRAAAGALTGNPDLALRLVVAALQARQAPVRITARHLPELAGIPGVGSQTWAHKGHNTPDFAEALALTEGSSQAALLDELAGLVAAALDLTDESRDHPAAQVRGQDALVAALDPDAFLGEARQVFDPEGYFDRIPSRTIVAAIAEMGGIRPEGKKAELVGHAAALARETGWLPEALRAEGYGIASPGRLNKGED